jgi:hypothetical protein
MKTFAIYETVQITQHRTIHIDAENEEQAVELYLDGKVDYDVDTEDEMDWDSAKIQSVEEVEE